MEKGYKQMITWNLDEVKGLNPDEIELLRADIQDAIDGVVEDWGI
jgi:hypothetical protein